MEASLIKSLGDELYGALQNRSSVKPLTERYPAITVADSYQISKVITDSRVAAGERIIGKKIGLTSKAVQNMLGVGEPDFGFLTDGMAYSQGQEMPISK
ncbi:MAG: 2-oxopent-4-enoate hydratase, partial [Gammaproteobacteria bacterium]|nr:2-oxopent-4-enoate hydratase [Gammaproteobacteria bacterium]